MATSPRNWLELDGLSNCVEVPIMPEKPTALTLEAKVLIKSGGTGRQSLIVAKPFELFVEENWLWVEAKTQRAENPRQAKTRLQPDTWYFVAMAWQGNARGGVGSLHVDGQYRAGFRTGFKEVNFYGRKIFFGAKDGGDFLNGSLAQTAIWQVKRTPRDDIAKIQPVIENFNAQGMNPAHHKLLGWWPLNEGSGKRALDHSGHGRHGEIQGTTTKSVTRRTNKGRKTVQLLETQWPTFETDNNPPKPTQAGRVMIQVTRDPHIDVMRQPKKAYIFPEDVVAHEGDTVEWLFTDKDVTDDKVKGFDTGPPSAIWKTKPAQNIGNKKKWDGIVVGTSGKFTFNLNVTDSSGTHDIDPSLECRRRRGRR